MSDFYQILKREIEPGSSPSTPNPTKGDLSVPEAPVENQSVLAPLKIKKINQKIKPKSKNIPTQKKNKLNISKNKIGRRKKTVDSFFSLEPANPIWLTMAEAAKLGGLQKRTIKRAVRSGHLKYRIVESRYQVDFRSALLYFYSKKKLWNKLIEFGLGQYVEKWRS